MIKLKDLLNEGIEYKIFRDLGFELETELKGSTNNNSLGYYQGSSTKEEKWFHKNLSGYSISLIGGSRNYSGFVIWDESKRQKIHYIWKRKNTTDGLMNKKLNALKKVATNFAKGKLPKSNQEQIKKHWNS